MSLRPSLRWIRRCWPQKVRTRLTLIYALLFLAGGSALLGLTYGLVASSLQPQTSAASKNLSVKRAEQFAICKQKADGANVPKQVFSQCQNAFAAGASAGSLSQRDRALHSLLFYSLVGLAVMTVASGGAGWVVSGRVLRPVRAITETARRASEQHLGERLALTGARDELKELADTFDDMLERLDQAFGTQRRFVANASHELRTPLTVMRTAIDVTLAKPSRTPEQLEAMAVRVRRSIDRAENMIDALLTLAISDQGSAASEPFDLATAAEDALDVVAADISRLGLKVESQLDPAQTSGDPHLLERMAGNLVDNAVRHNEPGGWIRLRTGASDGIVFLQIANSGPHVPGDTVPALFEPFQRLSARTGSRDGAGLGLSIVRSIAAAHQATVVVLSQPAGGLDVRVALPRHDPAASSGG
jgi:signal transduction histidine kinase